MPFGGSGSGVHDAVSGSHGRAEPSGSRVRNASESARTSCVRIHSTPCSAHHSSADSVAVLSEHGEVTFLNHAITDNPGDQLRGQSLEAGQAV